MFEILFFLFWTPYRVYKGSLEELGKLTDIEEVPETLRDLEEIGWINVQYYGNDIWRIMLSRQSESRLMKLKAEAVSHLIQLIK